MRIGIIWVVVEAGEALLTATISITEPRAIFIMAIALVIGESNVAIAVAATLELLLSLIDCCTRIKVVSSASVMVDHCKMLRHGARSAPISKKYLQQGSGDSRRRSKPPNRRP